MGSQQAVAVAASIPLELEAAVEEKSIPQVVALSWLHR